MPLEVTAPAMERYAYGLLSAAAVLSGDDIHWEQWGVEYWTADCALSGGIWYDDCLFPPPTPTPTQAFLVTFTKAINTDVVTATLTARDTGYATTPVTVSVGGVVKTLATVGATQTWTVTPSSTVPTAASIAALDNYPPCSATGTYVVPATAAAGPSTPLACTVDVYPPDRTKDIAAGLVPVAGVPFIVYDGMACASLGLAEVSPAAENKFAQREQWWVEQTFEQAVLHVGTDTIGPASPVSITYGLGLLEDAIADRYGGIGTIHVARELAAVLTSHQVVRRDGARLRSPLDNVYAFGAGYSTDGPDGTPAPAGQAWMYATGPVTVRRSEVQVREQFDQRKNTRIALAERSYAITADCLRVAVLVNLPEV